MMDLNFINAFTQSLYLICKNQLNIDCKKETLEIRAHPIITRGVSLIITTQGQVEGKIIMAMELESSYMLTTRLVDEYINAVNDQFTLAFKEFGFMICNKATSSFSQKKIKCQLSLPLVLVGEGVRLAELSEVQIVLVPFQTDIGRIDTYFIVEHKEF